MALTVFFFRVGLGCIFLVYLINYLLIYAKICFFNSNLTCFFAASGNGTIVVCYGCNFPDRTS